MILLTIFLTYTLGYSLLTAVAPKLNYLEKIGGSYLLGIGLQVLWMILLDFVGIPLNLTSVYATNLISTAFCLFIIYRQNTSILSSLFPYNPLKGKKWHKVNLPWLVIMGFWGYLVYMVALKCLFWPAFEFDALSGYDLTAKITAAEGTFRNSIFIATGTPIHSMGMRAIYPPLTQFSFALAYMSGMELSKIMTLMFYGNFFILLYGLLRRKLSHLNVAFIFLLITIVPELTSHAALSQTNLPQAIYVSTGIYSIYLWYNSKQKERSLFYLSMLLLSSSSIIRSENIIFCLVAGGLVLFQAIQTRAKKDFIQMLLYAAVLLFPFILWSIFLKVYGLRVGEENSLSLVLSYDAEKFSEWWALFWGGEGSPEGIILNKNFYGITSHLYFLSLFGSSIFIGIYYYLYHKKQALQAQLKKSLKSHLSLLYLTFMAFLLYSILFYFIRYDWDSMRNVMLYSYKRGLFAVMILFSIFSGGNVFIQKAFDWLTHFMYPKID